jgi:small-conductance mechanosensitive channel
MSQHKRLHFVHDTVLPTESMAITNTARCARIVVCSLAILLCSRTFCAAQGIAEAANVSAAAPQAEPGTTGASVSSASSGITTSKELDETIEECRQNLERLRAQVAVSNMSAQPVPRMVAVELELWGRLELLTLQRRTAIEDDESARLERSGIANAQSAFASPTSFLEVDELRDRLESEKQQLRALNLEWQAEKKIILSVKQKFEEAEQLRRRADERYQRSAGEQRDDRNQERILTRLQSRVVLAELELNRQQASIMSVRIESLQSSVAGLEAVVNANASTFTLSQEELDQRLKRIDQMESQVRAQLTEVDARLHASMNDQHAGGDPWQTTVYEVAREESQLFQRLLSGVGEFKDCWRKRFALSNGSVSAAEIDHWLEEAAQTKEWVAQIVEQLEFRTQQRRETLSQINRAALGNESTEPATELKNQAAELHRIIDTYGEIQILAAGGERLCQRLVDDLKARENRFSLGEYTQLGIGAIRAAWEYELTAVDDKPITVRKIVFGLILLLCGYYCSRMLAGAFAYRVSPRLGVTPAGAAVLRSVLFYLLVTAFAFASLEIVNVPLTVFAFLGGAVAIGVGFGSQNLINNFISGLILLVERPIRIGDLVNVDGIDANVEHIGARSTRVRTGTNLEILVPNSKFLENNVANWTFTDSRTRTSVSIGVAYGSPVREVMEILERVIRRHEAALSTPEPIVLFQDFADSALVFEVHFWINMRRMMDGAKIRSEVRVAIDDAFRQAGIVIAFPQRDVHIDMSAPIEVRLAEPAPATLKMPHRRAA